MKKTKKKFDPFENLVLDAYEQEIEDSIPEDGVLPRASAENLALFKEAARNYTLLNSTKRINIRVNNEDLAKVRAKAKTNKIPYQTLLGSLIHKYAKGDLTITL
jgi:predicted DNA binding CopG/RHH family protein